MVRAADGNGHQASCSSVAAIAPSALTAHVHKGHQTGKPLGLSSCTCERSDHLPAAVPRPAQIRPLAGARTSFVARSSSMSHSCCSMRSSAACSPQGTSDAAPAPAPSSAAVWVWVPAPRGLPGSDLQSPELRCQQAESSRPASVSTLSCCSSHLPSNCGLCTLLRHEDASDSLDGVQWPHSAHRYMPFNCALVLKSTSCMAAESTARLRRPEAAETPQQSPQLPTCPAGAASRTPTAAHAAASAHARRRRGRTPRPPRTPGAAARSPGAGTPVRAHVRTHLTARLKAG